MLRRFRITLDLGAVLVVVVANTVYTAWHDHRETWVRRVAEAADLALRQAARMIAEAGGLDGIRDEVHWQRLRCPSPVDDLVTRTKFGRPRLSLRLSTARPNTKTTIWSRITAG